MARRAGLQGPAAPGTPLFRRYISHPAGVRKAPSAVASPLMVWAARRSSAAIWRREVAVRSGAATQSLVQMATGCPALRDVRTPIDPRAVHNS
jgi:hypothetical protein